MTVSDPANQFDGPWKEALEGFFGPFLATLFPAVHAGIDWSGRPSSTNWIGSGVG